MVWFISQGHMTLRVNFGVNQNSVKVDEVVQYLSLQRVWHLPFSPTRYGWEGIFWNSGECSVTLPFSGWTYCSHLPWVLPDLHVLNPKSKSSIHGEKWQWKSNENTAPVASSSALLGQTWASQGRCVLPGGTLSATHLRALTEVSFHSQPRANFWELERKPTRLHF